MKYATLYMTGPTQSWGDSSDWNLRTTNIFPTKSGVLGGMFATLGIDREFSSEYYPKVKSVRMTSLMFGVPNIFTDFHVVTNVPVALTGKLNSDISKRNSVTHREYITNVSYGVILEGDDEVIEWLCSRMKNPKWKFSLGKKCCIPTEPIYSGIFNTKEEAITEAKRRYNQTLKLTDTTSSEKVIRVQEECGFNDHTEILRDNPKGNRNFGMRYVKIYELNT